MYFSKTLITAVATACTFGSAMALPQAENPSSTRTEIEARAAHNDALSVLHKRVPNANEQSCHATDWYDLFKGYGAVYTVEVGVTFANGNGCSAINQALNGALSAKYYSGVWDWSCYMIDGGNTGLSFSTMQSRGMQINQALGSMYPMVNGFNCPDY